jgi:MoxR-like ATPase
MAIGDRRIVVPRVGVIEADPTFRVVASMNPFDNIGTMRLSSSVHDRLCRLAVGYQDANAERGIVELRAGLDDEDRFVPRLIADSVAVTHATREHRDVRRGSSVRGAIDTAVLGAELARCAGYRPERARRTLTPCLTR